MWLSTSSQNYRTLKDIFLELEQKTDFLRF